MEASRIFRFCLCFTVVAFASLILCQQKCLAKITVSGLFSDHMVIQRRGPIRIFGKASPKEIIGVKLGPNNKVVVFADQNGDWLAKLKPMEAGGPYTLTIVGSEKIEINDVLIGEVWLCSGQSNMALTCKASHLEDRVSTMKFASNMRFISLPCKVSSEIESRVDARWQFFNNTSALECSAIGTAFAKRINQEIDVPVGIIVSAVGGSPIQPWISRSCLNSYPDGRGILKKTDRIIDSLKKQNINTRNLVMDQAKSKLKKIENDPARQLFLSSTTLYNSMIAPLVPFTLRGVLWYQGEANVYQSEDYQNYLTTMIKDWRTKWKQPHLPFLYVQLAPVGKRQSTPVDESPVAELRYAQAKTNILPYSYMAVTLDCCPIDNPDWHASDKIKIGNRLAEMALATQYNKPYAYKSPSVLTYDLKKNRVVLHFKNTMKKLKAGDQEVKGFAISGSDKKLFWANAEIKGDSVIVWSDKVKKPAFVEYAWADNPRGNLTGGGDLPAVPFQLELE